jgi:hypothetical protein
MCSNCALAHTLLIFTFATNCVVLQEVHAQAVASDNARDTVHLSDLAVYLVDISATLLSVTQCGGAAVASVLQVMLDDYLNSMHSLLSFITLRY